MPAATTTIPVPLPWLRGCERGHDRAESLALDPVRFARRYRRRQDREVAAFLAALLAFGNVKAIGRSVEALLGALGRSPADGVRAVSDGRLRLPAGLKHRWLDSVKLELAAAALGRALESAGSLEALFMRGFDASRDPDVEVGLARFSAALRVPAFPSPALGSACKRPCLFLRWVVRPDDGIDLGLWGGVPTSKLVMPVDVHVARVARRFGLTRRRTADWKMAREVTRALAAFDPLDPLRFDFDMVYSDRSGAW